MQIRLTMCPSGNPRLLALYRVLRETGLRVAGDIRQRGTHEVEFSVATTDAGSISSLCAALIERGLAETVYVERVDID
jgi:hypothetical protein